VFGIIHDWDDCRYTHVEIVMGMRKILGQLTLDWPVLRLWLVIVGDAGATGVADSHIDRDIVAVLSQVEAPL
jgi:hypothetical protein